MLICVPLSCPLDSVPASGMLIICAAVSCMLIICVGNGVSHIYQIHQSLSRLLFVLQRAIAASC